tara:strand:- start:1412 stop:2509 length:1098 start_codon:yes stop_codon:yes gene_type:complete
LQKNKINLVVFIPKFKFSGAGNSVFRLINFLDANKFNINVICLNKCDYKKKFNKKVNIYEFNSDRLIYSFVGILKLVKLISQNYSKNIILSNHHYANVYSIIIKLFLKNVSVVGVERTCIYELSHYYSIKDFLKKNILRLLVKKTYKYSDNIISNTKFTKKEIEQFSKDNTKQIYPPTLKKILKFKKKKISKYFNVLWVGRLDREKGINDFLEIIKKINFKSKIFILGDGELKNHYKSLIKDNKNFNVKVYFKGFLKDSSKYYNKCHLLINTSHFEGSNNSMIEAMNHNLIVMASNTPGGNKEIVDNTNGVLFNLEDVDKTIDKIKDIRNNYSNLQIKLKSKKNFLKNFIEKKSNSKYLEILNKI